MEKNESKINIQTGGNNMQNDVSIRITAAQIPTINVTPTSSDFISIVGDMSTTQAFVVSSENLSSNITAIAPANFQVSSDGVNWGDSTFIEANGGALYVKYLPIAIEINQVDTIKLISEGAETKNITITGLSFTPTTEISSYLNFDAKPGEAQTKQTHTRVDTNPTNDDNNFWTLLKLFSSYATVLLSFIILLRIYELFINQLDTNIKSRMVGFISTTLLSDLLFFCTIAGYLFVFTGIIYFISRKLSRVLLIVLSTIIALGHFLLIKYFSVALNPLGSDVFQYSLAEIKLTVGSAVNLTMILTVCGMLAVFVLAFIYFSRFIKVNKAVAVTFLTLSLAGILLSFNKVPLSPKFGSEYNNNLTLNKSNYFYSAVWQYYFPQPERDIFDEMSEMFADNMIGNSHESTCINDFTLKDDANYPFLHADSTKDVLSPFFNKGNTPPNVVIIVVEGLGRAFSNENAYLGSFTPFIDSLSQHSLYWENCLSSAGRTFSVSPSVLGSLPYGQHGFAELGEHMPSHLGLINILAANGYKSSFFYGGDSKFDNMKLFMERQHVNHIYDEATYDHSYKKLPANPQGFTWGYGDSELFRRYLAELDKQPNNTQQVNILLTIATHSPFKLNDQNRYDALFEKRMQDLKFDAAAIKEHREYKPQYASIMYMDDAIRHFFKSYASRPSFANTVFIITGDHRMPDIPMSTKIDRYHVPLIIYSPMLKRTAKFSAVVSHLDITPSLLAYVKKQCHIKSPSLVTWLGAGLDTVRYFRNRSNYPLIPTKQGVSEYLSGYYMISGNSLFQLSANMGLDPVNNDDKERARLTQLMNKFIQLNDRMITKKKMLPDSILARYSVK
jgi:phosphoglycerol transferase MdoB-like AlkP superfamily enzyme